jgi:hypothetical protein
VPLAALRRQPGCLHPQRWVVSYLNSANFWLFLSRFPPDRLRKFGHCCTFAHISAAYTITSMIFYPLLLTLPLIDRPPQVHVIPFLSDLLLYRKRSLMPFLAISSGEIVSFTSRLKRFRWLISPIIFSLNNCVLFRNCSIKYCSASDTRS